MAWMSAPFPPRTWLLLGRKAGDNEQVRALAEALGWPCEEVHLRFRPWEILTNLILDAALTGLDASRSDPLRPPWPGLIITAGRRNEPIAFWLQKKTAGQARIVHLGRPWRHPRRLDLVITTPQYQVPPLDNVVSVSVPLHRVHSEALAEARELWRRRLEHLPRPRIGVLIGGNSGPFTLDRFRARTLLGAAEALAGETAGSLLITTSARTPAHVRTLVESMTTAPQHRFFWGDGGENPYLGYLALSDAFIVTGESISMLVEACATEKPVHVYEPGDHPVPLPGSMRSRPPCWRDPGNYRPGALVHRLAMAMAPRRMRRDVRVIQQALVTEGRAVWLGQHWRHSSPPPLSTDTDRVVARVHALFRGG